MHQFEKKNSNIFSPKGPRENVFPGPAVALDVLAWNRTLADMYYLLQSLGSKLVAKRRHTIATYCRRKLKTFLFCQS